MIHSAVSRSALRFALETAEGLGLLPLVLLTWPVSRHWLENWGSRPDERGRRWPGDELVTEINTAYTRAIDIAAAGPDVWQWVVQLGLGRAGFYSYELFERLVGIPVTNIESVVPELQSLSVGDEIRLHPKAPGIPVGMLQQGTHVCFGILEEPGETRSRPDPSRSWSMYIQPTGPDSSRLVVRNCIEPVREPSLSKQLSLALEEPIDFLMEQRMLRTIRRLAESAAGQARLHVRPEGVQPSW
jgi:hypothetical protein